MVKIVSDAELGGVLEDFAKTGGIAVANVIMTDFARRAAEEFAKDAAPAVEAASPPAPQPAPLAAGACSGSSIKAYWRRFLRAFGIVAQ